MEPQARFEAQAANAEDPFGHYLRVIVRHWRLVGGFFLAGCLIAAVYSLLLPKEYEATASVLPPQDSSGSRAALGGLAAQSGAGPMLGVLPFGITSTKDIFLGILKSRTMQDDVIKKFDLVKVYELEKSKTPLKSSRTKLASMTDIKASREGVISVTAGAYDPKMAADIANFYVENLDRLNTTINITDAGRTRLFLESRVADAQKALGDAENRMKEYQSRSKAVVMEGQTKAAIEGAARLEGQILAAEVQLKTLETFSTQRNPDVIKTKEAIDEMRRQLKRMEYGRGTGNPTAEPGGAVGDFSVALGSIPSTGVELAWLIREAKIQETIYTLLTEQLEQAKIAEAKDTPTVKILDRAVVPETKSRPSVRRNTVLGGLFSLGVGVALAFCLESLGRRKRGANRREQNHIAGSRSTTSSPPSPIPSR
jgi:uncharacterized protein involved in exopolysaccharide biosynthesis